MQADPSLGLIFLALVPAPLKLLLLVGLVASALP